MTDGRFLALLVDHVRLGVAAGPVLGAARAVALVTSPWFLITTWGQDVVSLVVMLPLSGLLQGVFYAVVGALVTAPLHVALAAGLTLLRAPRALRPIAAATCAAPAVLAARYLEAVDWYAVSFEWSTSWNSSDYPSWGFFFYFIAQLPLLAGVGTGWAVWTAGRRFLEAGSRPTTSSGRASLIRPGYPAGV